MNVDEEMAKLRRSDYLECRSKGMSKEAICEKYMIKQVRSLREYYLPMWGIRSADDEIKALREYRGIDMPPEKKRLVFVKPLEEIEETKDEEQQTLETDNRTFNEILKEASIDPSMNIFICNTCGEKFPPTALGYASAEEHHILSKHFKGLSLINIKTGDVLVEGSGSHLLLYARRNKLIIASKKETNGRLTKFVNSPERKKPIQQAMEDLVLKIHSKKKVETKEEPTMSTETIINQQEDTSFAADVIKEAVHLHERNLVSFQDTMILLALDALADGVHKKSSEHAHRTSDTTFSDRVALLHREISSMYDAYKNQSGTVAIEDEAAEVILRLMDTCRAFKLDIAGAVMRRQAQ